MVKDLEDAGDFVGMGDVGGVRLEAWVGVGGDGEEGDAVGDGEVAQAVTDAGAACGVKVGHGEDAVDAGAFGDVGKVTVDPRDGHGEAEAPAFVGEAAFEEGQCGAERGRVGVPEGDGGGFAGLDDEPFGNPIAFEIDGGVAYPGEVVGGDGGVAEEALVSRVVDPHAVLADAGDAGVGDETAECLDERLWAS